MGISKYIYLGFTITLAIVLGGFYYYYTTTQEELKIMHGNIEVLKIHKQTLTSEIEQQKKDVVEFVNELNKKQKILEKLERESFEIRSENQKIKTKLSERNFDKIVLSSEKRKLKVEKVLKESTFRELSELEMITNRIKNKGEENGNDK